ncbi:MATE family efflux transporter [Martelella mediterranea]|uniref:Multidrug export protein MepA n=1 Tax=Martelella mediterranea TaxID=293089 RepID=A0A4R3NXB6_9HYPH|nr:MATE family efflux transporter [Martelella mediterranea]TCT45034.1 putative MATE family efflux protein [Martelella mediterranea]
MNTSDEARANPYLAGALGPLFFKTAAPIVLLMLVSGLFTVVDALFLGWYVGPLALAAVTLVFPVFMALNACTTLVSSGMASILARRLGASDHAGAQSAMQSATLLAMLVSIILMGVYLLAGPSFIAWLAQGDEALSAMAKTYIAIVIFGSPLAFLIGIQGDTLRSEGKPGVMALIGVFVTLANIGFNYVFIARFGWGVSGSAFGTLAAQCVALMAVLILRLSGKTPIRLWARTGKPWHEAWRRTLALGLPQSLALIGTSLTTASYLIAVKYWGGDNYDVTIAAYGIASRLLTFAFLPLMGLNFACQSIVGNNFGARAFARSDRTLMIGLAVGLCYGLTVELTFQLGAAPISALFVSDPATVDAAVRIVRIVSAAYVLVAPLMVLSGYFQALGQAASAAAISLGRTYLFTIPLVFVLPRFLEETGIWLASPFSDVGMLMLALAVLFVNTRRTFARFGVFYTAGIRA